MAASVTEYIQEQLTTIADNVYTGYNPDNTYPCIVHALDNTDPVQCMSKAVDFELFDYDIEIWATTRQEANAIATQVRQLFDNTSNSGDEIHKVIYRNREETWMMATAGSTYHDEQKRIFGVILSFDFWAYI